MKSRNFALLLLILAYFSKGVYAQSSPPNIIIILADDLGYADVGFNGSKDIPTPNIDRIAENGVTFSRGYVSYAVCGPSRAGLITGIYQDKFGFSKNPLLAPNDPAMGLPLNQQTLGAFLKQQHYVTGAIGKWHLGVYKTLRPNQRGFDYFFGFLSGGHKYFPKEWTLNNLSEVKSQFDAYRTKLLRNNKRVDEKEYITDAFSREAVGFVDRNYRKPFFLYLAYNAPHTPLEATQKYLDRFPNIKDKKRRTYAAMISALDDGVGKLLDKLKSLHIEKNTLIFFLSDNGGPIYSNGSSNAPLRGKKGDFFEGGIHVPFAAQWIGHIPRDSKYNEPVISLDIFATAAALVNAKPKNPLDGVNLMPFVTSKSKGLPHGDLYWRNFANGRFAVVEPTYKRIDQRGKLPMLFNLSQDIGEKTNLSDKVNYQPIMNDLESKITAWSKLLEAPKFEGLLQDKKYSKEHPDRWKVEVNNY